MLPKAYLTGERLKAYFHQTRIVGEDPSEANLNKLQRLQEQLEARDAWQFEQQIEQTLTMLRLDPEISLSTLSGGWRSSASSCACSTAGFAYC